MAKFKAGDVVRLKPPMGGEKGEKMVVLSSTNGQDGTECQGAAVVDARVSVRSSYGGSPEEYFEWELAGVFSAPGVQENIKESA